MRSELCGTKIKYSAVTVINPNFTATNSAHFHLSAGSPAEIPSERISPTNPKCQQNNVSPQQTRPRGNVFPAGEQCRNISFRSVPGVSHSLSVSGCPALTAGAGNDARNKEPRPRPLGCSLLAALPDTEPPGDEVYATDRFFASGSAGGRGGQSHVPQSDPRRGSPRPGGAGGKPPVPSDGNSQRGFHSC